jgi:hypothetical protein
MLCIPIDGVWIVRLVGWGLAKRYVGNRLGERRCSDGKIRFSIWLSVCGYIFWCWDCPCHSCAVSLAPCLSEYRPELCLSGAELTQQLPLLFVLCDRFVAYRKALVLPWSAASAVLGADLGVANNCPFVNCQSF